VRQRNFDLSKEPSHPFPHGAQDSGLLPEIAPSLFSFILLRLVFFDGDIPIFNEQCK